MSINSFLAIGVAAVLAFRAPHAEGSLPSVPFGELAREAECILIAESMPPQKQQEGAQGHSQSHSFMPIGQAATLCDLSRVTVSVRTNEVPRELAGGIYLVFLKRRGATAFAYANEPFGHLRIKDGLVDTLPFFELGKAKVSLEELLGRIRNERSRPK